MDRFAQILYDLGKVLQVDLYPDKRRVCKLNIEGGRLHIQIECEEPKERLLLATFLGEIPAGKFRENLLKEALKTNDHLPHIGTLAYVERNNQLSLFEYVPLERLTGDKLAAILSKFIEKANLWHTAIQRGVVPPTEGGSGKGPSMFGLK